MLAFVASLLLLQAPAQPTAPAGALRETAPRVLVLETRADDAHLADVRAFGDLLATLLERRTTAEIIPASSVKDRLAVAAEKLAAGCDETACMTEIAGAIDARFVVTSRASQVGGRWLMRVELFDSRDLKVVAQTSVMSDSVEGLAAMAEMLADDLMVRAPMLPGRSSSEQAGDNTLPPPDARRGPGSLPWIVAGTSTVAALGLAGLATWSYLEASDDESKLESALGSYEADPGVDTRKALAAAGISADNSSLLHNCLLLPLGCLCVPLGGVAVGATWWGLTDQGESADGAAP